MGHITGSALSSETLRCSCTCCFTSFAFTGIATSSRYSTSAIADSPLHRSQLTSVALNKQPISGKIPPLIPEFSRVQVISLATDLLFQCPCSPNCKRPGTQIRQYHYLLARVCFDAHVKSWGLKMVCMNQNAMCKS